MSEPIDPASRRSFTKVMRFDRTAPSELLDALWSDPDALVARGGTIKPGDRCTIVRVPSDGRDYVIKRFNPRGPLHTFVHWFLRSRASWNWRNGRLLVRAGVPTPRPIAALEERWGPLRRRSFLVTGFIPGSTLLERMNDPEVTPNERERIATAFATLWSDLGRLRHTHGDMKATNFIVDHEKRVWVVDLDAMRRRRITAALRRGRRRDRERFLRNWQDHPEAAAAFRARLDTG